MDEAVRAAMSEVRIRTGGRPVLHAELDRSGTDQLGAAATAIGALFTLADGVFAPLSADVVLACCDAATGYPLEPAGYHQLRVADLPPLVATRELWTGTREERCERFDRESVLGWIGGLLAAQRCAGEDLLPGWSQLFVQATRVRLPAGVADSVHDGELVVSYGNGTIRYPVEDAAEALWVAGPLATNSETAPMEVEIGNEGGFLSLDLSLNWSTWADADGPGRAGVEAAFARLTDLGWDVSRELA
ncbi:hypothetical protein FPZ12_001800 [Amycolatopsis acidicola]|uniref:Uncharacterized protein n=1 Tax=Amycolatopsis acidicola TaxID=2596893 RepID=A0A5N0VJE0_9PSEU|nr:hypothetical protein [Amycolatopsis acidicola]KAA9166325.1 hypothetical protein FPZ12_001800 [Amycolatopsis acidicola]